VGADLLTRAIEARSRQGGFGNYRHALARRSGPQPLYPTPDDVMPGNISCDGTLVFAAGEQTGRRAILTLSLAETTSADLTGHRIPPINSRTDESVG
jgi:hypothetical protein